MTGRQEMQQMYEADAGLRTLASVNPFAQAIVATAQERTVTRGRHSKTWVNSRACRLVGDRVAELVFITATKIGATVDPQTLEYIDPTDTIEGADDTIKPGTPFGRMAGIAAWIAAHQVRSEIEDAGNRVDSAATEEVALRVGAISLRFLESLGANIDSDEFVEALDDTDMTSGLIEIGAVLADEQDAEADDSMTLVMEMLRLQTVIGTTNN